MNFIPRKLLFKAWNKESRLMMRLNSIDCVKGELVRKDHIILQFTGLYDKHDEEIYEMDIVLIGREKFMVIWDPERSGWALSAYPKAEAYRPFSRTGSETVTRICSYFESEKTV